MIKRTKILLIASLLFAVGSPQTLFAKKIVFLGHEYKGDVNDKNMPEGKGQIYIGGIIIKGVFDGKTINEATFQTDWLSFNGTITYDRDNKIVLKENGTFNKYYYKWEDVKFGNQGYLEPSSLVGKKRIVNENLNEDKVYDTDLINRDTLRLPYSFKMVDVPNELTPPNVETFVEVPLHLYSFGYYGHKDGELRAYIFDENHHDIPWAETVKRVQGYKDEQGRIWNYIKGWEINGNVTPTYYAVTYPNRSVYVSNGTWQVVVVDGTKKFVHTYDAVNKVLLEDENSIIIGFKGGTELSDYLRYVEAQKTDIVLPVGTQILISYNDQKPNDSNIYKTSEEIEKLIKQILSYYKLESPFGAKIYWRGYNKKFEADNDYYLGRFENGHYIPNKK